MQTLERESGSAKTLAPAIASLLCAHRIAMKDLGAIALLTGPGSFTGLRVGVATAKAMAYALRIPAIEIDTLDVIAMQCPVASPSVYAVMDAYRGQVFCAEYAKGDSAPAPGFVRKSATEILDIDPFLERAIQSGSGEGTIDIGGTGCDRIRKFLMVAEDSAHGSGAEWRSRIRWIDGPAVEPHAESVARLGYAKWVVGDVMDPFLIQPRYYRASAAEEMAAARGSDRPA